ncbi:MAG: glucosamine inositolphosphorylceramide transferase family protein, partial [Beijerinckiaceae bacterium]
MPHLILRYADGCQNRLAGLIATRLRREAAATVTLAPENAAVSTAALPAWFIRLDSALYGQGSGSMTAPLASDAARATDWIIDLVSRRAAHSSDGDVDPARRLHPHFNGAPDITAASAGLLTGVAPVISLVDGAGQTVAEARPALEAARHLNGALDAVQSRLTSLIVATVARPCHRLLSDGGNAAAAPADAPAFLAPAQAMRRIGCRAAEITANRFRRADHWRIGWRWNDGPGVLDTLALSGPRWHVLAEAGDRFYADPFPVEWQGQYALLFEELRYADGKGILSALLFDADGKPGAVQTILEEAHHLSYPFLFVHEGRLWMIPESSQACEIALYACTEFPWRWEKHSVLLRGIEAADTTLHQHDGLWWMFTVTRPGDGGYSDTLEMYWASSPLGPWHPHDKNPVLIDGAVARPGGAMGMHQGRLLRPVQDCSMIYGAALNIAAVTQLSRTQFRQDIVGRIRPD